MTEPTKLSEAVARAILKARGISPDKYIPVCNQTAFELSLGQAQAAIRAVLEWIDAMDFDDMRKYAQEATWRAADDVEKGARVLHATALWREMSRYIKKRECGPASSCKPQRREVI